MNPDIMQAAGFGKEVDKVAVARCPFCNVDISTIPFKDALSRTEYGISGLCQRCQDKMFGGDDG